MITRIVLHNLFTGEQVYVLGIPKPLAHLLTVVAENHPTGLHQIKLKKQV